MGILDNLLRPSSSKNSAQDVNNPAVDRIYATPAMQEHARNMAKELLSKKPEIKHWTQGIAYLMDTLAGKQYENMAGNNATYYGAERPSGQPAGSMQPQDPMPQRPTGAIPQSQQPMLDALAPEKAAAPEQPPMQGVPGIGVGPTPAGVDPSMLKPDMAPSAPMPSPVAPSSKIGAWNTRVHVNYDGQPASVRANNPGASWTNPKDDKYGVEGYDIIGGGNRIGKFPTTAHGLASNMDLMSGPGYAGSTLGAATAKWRGGNPGSNMTPRFEMSDGTKIGPQTVLTPELLKNEEFMTRVFGHYADHEAGRKNKIKSDELKTAFEMYQAGGADNYNKALAERKGVQAFAPPGIAKAAMVPAALEGRMNLGGEPPMGDDKQFGQQIAQAQARQPAQPPIAQPSTPAAPQFGMPGAPNTPTPAVQPGMGLHELQGMLTNPEARAALEAYRNSYKPQDIDASRPQYRVQPGAPNQPGSAQYMLPHAQTVNGADVAPQVNRETGAREMPVATPTGGFDALGAMNEEKKKAEARGESVGYDFSKNNEDIHNLWRGQENTYNRLNSLATIRALDAMKEKDGNMQGSTLEAPVQEALRKLGFITGGQAELNSMSVRDIKAATMAGLKREAESAVKQYGSANNLASIEASHPSLTQSLKSQQGIEDIMRQKLQIEAKFVESLHGLQIKDRGDLQKIKNDFYANNPITIKGMSGHPDVKVGNWKTDEAFEKTVKPGEWFLYNGKLQKRER